MTVYVDNARIPFGRMLMCHMWADTRAELFAMADAIGVRRRWFQRPPAVGGPGMDASWEHFDISVGKRAEAVRLGAVETDRFGPMAHLARLDVESGDPVRAERGRRMLGNVEKSRALRRADVRLPEAAAGRSGLETAETGDVASDQAANRSGRSKGDTQSPLSVGSTPANAAECALEAQFSGSDRRKKGDTQSPSGGDRP